MKTETAVKAAPREKKPRRSMMTFERRRQLTGYVFLSPWLFASIFLLFFPLLFSLILSFTDGANIQQLKMNFVGIENYKNAFLSDINFIYCLQQVTKETFYNGPMIIVFSLIIAIMLSRDIKARGFFRSAFFLPVLLGTGYILEQILGQGVSEDAMSAVRGIILTPEIASYLGEDLSQTVSEFLSRITTVMWQSGVQIILFLAGIQKIPQSLYESARVDSATEWEMLWKITLPMLSQIILLNIVYTAIALFAQDSPMIDYITTTAFKTSYGTLSGFEYASAMGWVFFLYIFLVVGVAFLVMRPFIKRSAS